MRVDIKVPFNCEPLKFVQDIKITLSIKLSECGDAEKITRRILLEKYPGIDFSSIDFNSLEHDSYTYSQPNILGFIRKSKTLKLYVIKCNKCCTDLKLWGMGITLSQRNNYESGKVSCSCSESTRYTEYQNTINAIRYDNNTNFKFLGWKGDYNGVYTKVKEYCKIHGFWDTTPLIDRRKGKGCPLCGNVLIKEHRLIDDKIHITEFMNTGSYEKETIFWRSTKKEKNGRLTYWNCICPICKDDSVVKSGECNGVFVAHVSNLKAGKTFCRCNRYNGESNKLLVIDNLLPSVVEYKFDDCRNIRTLPFDRYSVQHNLLLEYDGEQHFNPIEHWGGIRNLIKIQNNDKIKSSYAIENGFNFIRIAYYEDAERALKSFLAYVKDNPDNQIVQIYGDLQII